MREQAFVTGDRLRLGRCVLDLAERELLAEDGRPVEMRPKTLEVLLLLGEHAGRVVDKATLMQRVWPGVVVGDDSLTQTVVEIRRALGDRERRILCTAARRGYRLQPSETSSQAMAPRFSVVVLPITYDSGDPDGMRWASTLTSELTARVGGGLPDSQVIGRVTAAARGESWSDPRSAARQFSVRHVLCGDLRAAANGWNLELGVVDGVSGARRWSHQFRLELPVMPEHIPKIGAQAARALLVEMHRYAAEVAGNLSACELSAEDLALQGWARVYEGICPDNLEGAKHYFEQAVEKDPSNVRGLCGLCISNYYPMLHGWARDREQARLRVLDTAAHLERLYPDHRLTALASGLAADLNGRWDLRLSIGDRLCDRDPADPTAHFVRAVGLLRLGRFGESVQAFDNARSLSINDFREGWWHLFSACAQLMSGRPRQAAVAAEHAIAANACLPLPHLLLAAALASDGKVDEGREVLQQHLVRAPECDRRQLELLLAGGNSVYQAGCTRIVATLLGLGLPDA